ncbi:hypothetical protein [Polluticaenibacter yanchengensis]|uniref:Uncharacterized protein n=1 Tax=Polluticaenibacter yanchengensis TaxID=3014562 RepID=A0ABT4ULP6_9BACT|nr:hypothetical protein [Chitinophagaceae bacterium LY-5]
MRKLAYILFSLMFLAVAVAGYGQSVSNKREKKIAFNNSTIKIDSLSIIPGSFSIQGFSENDYVVDYVNATVFIKKTLTNDSLNIFYRVYPFNFSSPVYKYRYDSIADNFKVLPGYSPGNKKNDIQTGAFDFGNIQYSGSLGRNLSFGNAQDAVVNSVFNLQIRGYIADSIKIAAAITDNNIPIQPDGTTQQLNEFDKVWMQFSKNNWEINIGDIDIRENPNYFLNYYKRQQGLAFEIKSKQNKKLTSRVLGSGAVAKGKFTRHILTAIEGNQGPYRLQGANNELYFVVLAGTERVFIDGQLLQRGADLDYIIDYNTAEIRFTNKHLITKDKRIQVEFEYADRNYLNTLFYVGGEVEYDRKLKVSWGLYSNADAKNSSINQTLSADQKHLLSQVGDSTQLAFSPMAQLDTFSATKVLYIKMDTTVNGQQYEIYRTYQANDRDLYSLGFTYMGFNKGNYELLNDGSNGKTYRWLAPISGRPQGSYEPVILLVAPKKQSLFSTSILYRLNDKTNIQAQVGLSNYDINTFSSLDKGNDRGLGLKFDITNQRNLKFWKNEWELKSNAGYEFVDKQFTPLERLRTVEFLRDWGLNYDEQKANEALPSAGFSLSTKDKSHQLNYYYTGYIRDDGYRGNRFILQEQTTKNGWTVNGIFNYTHINSDGFNGYFLRPSVDVSKTFKRLNHYQLSAKYFVERNPVLYNNGDSISRNSFAFNDMTVALKSNAAKPNKWGVSWNQRRNELPYLKTLEQSDVSNSYSAFAELTKSSKHQLRFNAIYRTLDVKSDMVSNLKSENSLISRTEYYTRLLNGALTGNVFYEIGSGQEQRRDFSFVEVQAGRGEYTWIDYNNDGVAQLNEFEIAQYQDQAKYIKLYTPTNNYVKANYNTFNYSLNFIPRVILNNSTIKWQQFLTKFSAQSMLQSNVKKVNEGNGLSFNPFSGNVSDTNLISVINTFSNTVSFNRFSTKWGLDYTQMKNTNKGIMSYGFETKTISEHQFKVRRNFGRQYLVDVTQKYGTNKLTTPNPLFDNRNYDIKIYSVEPKVTFTYASKYRSSLSLKYVTKDGESSKEALSADIYSLQSESKLNIWQSAFINAKLSFNQIKYVGERNTSASYVMLDALQPGKNWLWNIDFTKRLANAIELSFQYEGRQSEGVRTIHVGRASLRAIL